MAILHALVVPGLVAAGSVAYWLQIAGARRAVVFVPSGILVLIAVFLAAVVIMQLRGGGENLRIGGRSLWNSLGLIALSVAYYFAFTGVGFHLANLLFIFAASLLMGLPIWKAVISALVVSLVLFGLADLMNFQLPEPAWFS